jgi:hypothetical protein
VQRARDAGLLGEEIAWFLINKFVDEAMYVIVETDPELKELGRRIDEIERAHGLGEDESFFVGKGPPEWEEATQAWAAINDRQYAELFRRIGEEEMAEQLSSGGEDPRFAAGREAIFGPLEDLEEDRDTEDGLDDADLR